MPGKKNVPWHILAERFLLYRKVISCNSKKHQFLNRCFSLAFAYFCIKIKYRFNFIPTLCFNFPLFFLLPASHSFWQIPYHIHRIHNSRNGSHD